MKKIFLIIVFTALLFPQERWTKLNGPEGGVITGLYTKGDTILAGTGYTKAKIFYSVNGGKEWKQANIKLNERFEDFVYSHDGSFLTAALSNGIYKSYDLDNWEKVFSSNYSNEDFWSMGIDMTGNLYAGADNGHIYTSTDYGKNWQHAAYAPARTQRFFLGEDSVLYTGSDNSIIRKEPDGKWMIIKPDTINGLNYSALTDEENKLYAFANSRVKRSDDSGKSWIKLDEDGFFNGQGRIEWIYDMIYNKRMIAACGDETGWFGVGYGIAVSDDKGQTWRWSNKGLPPKLSIAYRLKSSGDDTYLGTNAAGVFKSTDFGENWFQVNKGIYSADVMDIFISKDKTIYAASWANGLSKSTDNGNSWLNINNGFTNCYLLSVLEDDDGILYAGTREGTFRSDDKGSNWYKITPPGNDFVFYLRKDSRNRLYAITYGSGVYRSVNKGISWERIDKGFLSSYTFGFAIDSLGNIYTGGRQGAIYRSKDDGESWVRLYQSVKASSVVSSITISPEGYLFASNIYEGILRSTDNGESWNLVKKEARFKSSWPIVINKKGEVYTPGDSSKFYKSTDIGESWLDITDNLDNVAVQYLTLHADNLYLATDESIWKSNPDYVSTIAGEKYDIPEEYSLSQNYPNPFNPNTIIKYQIPVNGLVSLKIYDILGKEISTLVNEEKSAGRYEVNFNASDLASGVYIYRVKVNEFVESRKMVLMK